MEGRCCPFTLQSLNTIAILLVHIMHFPFKAEVINYKGDLNTPPDQVQFFRSEMYFTSDQPDFTSTNQIFISTNQIFSEIFFTSDQPGGEEKEDKLCGEEDEDGQGQGRRGRVQR